MATNERDHLLYGDHVVSHASADEPDEQISRFDIGASSAFTRSSNGRDYKVNVTDSLAGVGTLQELETRYRELAAEVNEAIKDGWKLRGTLPGSSGVSQP